MGDPKAGDRPAFSLSPGCRFHPSEDQLFGFYLVNKNMNPSRDDHCNVIRELDLYNHFPPELPDSVCFPYGSGGRKRHWYCYTVGGSRERRNRRAKGGFWRRRGRVKEVTGGNGGNVLLGTRTRFVFYFGNSAMTATRTDWIMSEYALVDHFEASFVLCRVSVKAKRGNNMSDKIMRSTAHESGSQVPDLHEELDINHSIGCMINISRGPMTVVVELNDHVTPGTVSEAGTQFHMDSQLGELVRYPEPPDSGLVSIDAVSAQQLTSILEDDYIELDDLISPLPGLD